MKRVIYSLVTGALLFTGTSTWAQDGTTRSTNSVDRTTTSTDRGMNDDGRSYSNWGWMGLAGLLGLMGLGGASRNRMPVRTNASI